jgi:hypothetical protein
VWLPGSHWAAFRWRFWVDICSQRLRCLLLPDCLAPFFCSSWYGVTFDQSELAPIPLQRSRGSALLTRPDIMIGLALGPIMNFGSFLGKRIVDHLPEGVFVLIIEAVLVIAGLTFPVRG